LHDGFYLRIALGAAWLSTSFDSQDSKFSQVGVSGRASAFGVAFDLMIGGTIAPGLVLAGGLLTNSTGAGRSEDFSADGSEVLPGDAAVTWEGIGFGFIGPVVDWYVDPTAGFHAMAGLGVTFLNAERGVADDVTVLEKHDSAGVGGVLGAGYEFWIANQWSLGATARFTYASLTGADPDGNATFSHTLMAPALLMTGTYH
jgi:hypothetical protein